MEDDQINEQGLEPAVESIQTEQPSVAETPTELPFSPDAIANALADAKATAQAAVGEREEQQIEVEQAAVETGEQPLEAGADPDKRVLPNRIATAQFDQVEQEAIALRKELRDAGEPVTLKEAIELVERRHTNARAKAEQAQTEQQQEVASPLQVTSARVEALTAQRSELLGKLSAVRADDPFSAEIGALELEIEGVRDELAEAKADHKTQARQEQEQAALGKEQTVNARQAVKEAALVNYPAAGDQNTPLGREVSAVIAEFKDPAHPDHAILFATKAPKLVIEEAVDRLATRVAKQQGISKAQAIQSISGKPAASPSPAAATQPERRVVLPVSGGKGTVPAGKQLTAVEILNDVGFDPAKIAAARKGLAKPGAPSTYVIG